LNGAGLQVAKTVLHFSFHFPFSIFHFSFVIGIRLVIEILLSLYGPQRIAMTNEGQ